MRLWRLTNLTMPVCLLSVPVRAVACAISLLLLPAASAFPAALTPSAPEHERVLASFVLARGRAPTAAELTAWLDRGESSVAALLEAHATELGRSAEERRAVLVRAYRDAFGAEPDAAVAASAARDAGETVTYTAWLKRHDAAIAQDATARADVINRAYRHVVRRDAYPEEHAYWKDRDTRLFMLLVGCVEHWARRNQPGLMVTAGAPTMSVNSDLLLNVRLSPGVAGEARDAAGLPLVSDDARGTHHVIAPGAAGIRSGGGMHFVVAGAP